MARAALAAVLIGTILAWTALRSGPLQAAQEPLPTPRGQLGGREDVDPGQPGIVATVPPLWPTLAAPTPFPPSPPDVTPAVPTEALAAPYRDSLVSVIAEAEDGVRIGTGWAWDDAGIVVTAAPLVVDADRVVVDLPDGEPVPVEVVAIDRAVGVAVLAIEGGALDGIGEPASAVEPGDDARVLGLSPDGPLPVGWTGTVGGGEDTGRCGTTFEPDVAGAVPPSWMAGAPVVGRGGMIGMLLPIDLPTTTTTPTVATPSVSDAGAPLRHGVACVVPVERIADVVASAGRAVDENPADGLAGSPIAQS